MRDLKLLYRYATKLYKPKKTKKKSNKLLSIISTLFIMAVFVIPMTFAFYEMFTMLAIPVSNLGIPYSGYIADIYMFTFPATLGLMAILTLVPSMVFNVYGADDIAFLLSLPIKKQTLFLFKALMGITSGIFPLLMIIISSICYAIVFKLNIVLVILGLLLFLSFILLLSIALGSLLTRFMSKSTARITSQIFLYISLLLYVLIMNIMPRQAENPQMVAIEFSKIFEILEGKYARLLPTNWLLYAIKGDIKVIGILGILCLILIPVSMKTVDLTGMKNGRISTKKRRKLGVSRHPIIKKELRIIMRNPQSLFSISYAMIFPLIMTYVNHSALSGSIFASMFAILYACNLGLQLLAKEQKIWPFQKLLPLPMGNMCRYKAFITTAIFTATYTIVLVAAYFITDMHPLMLLSIIPMAIVIFYSTIYALELFLEVPNRVIKADTASLNFKEGLSLQFKNIFLSLGIIIPFYLWCELYTKDTTLFPSITLLWWHKLLPLVPPLIIIIITIFLIKKSFRKIDSNIGAWE